MVLYGIAAIYRLGFECRVHIIDMCLVDWGRTYLLLLISLYSHLMFIFIHLAIKQVRDAVVSSLYR